MKSTITKVALLLAWICLGTGSGVWSQGAPSEYDGGMKVKLNDDGSKYFRWITWAQVQAIYTANPAQETSPVNFNLRRARMLLYAQVNKKFLILSHFGLNSLNASNMDPLGKGGSSQLFFHDFWAQYSLAGDHVIGGGLHYYNGINRLNSQSTLNFMTLDNNRQSWSTIGLSDQFARHLGIFAKGSFGQFQYRVSVNEALAQSLDTRDPNTEFAVYEGRRLLGSAKAGFTYTGYFEYHFLDEESNFLPYRVGSYLGSKKVLNVGAGFFLHPNGAVLTTDSLGTLSGENVQLFAADVFYDAPIGENGGALTAYGTYQMNDYGTDYLFSAYGSGNMVYGHVGYVIPGQIKGNLRFQPYISFQNHQFDATPEGRNTLGAGLNAYFYGHHSKLTLEYRHTAMGGNTTQTVTLQGMVYL